MPHSLSPEKSGSTDQDAMATDTEKSVGEVQPTVAAATTDTQTLDGDSQNSENTDQDTTMVDNEASAVVVKDEVRLEDLFADIDSDEEFPSSTGNMKVTSSPQAPESPMLVSAHSVTSNTD